MLDHMLDLRSAFQSSPLFIEIEQMNRGEKPHNESQAKRHHFLSQFQLRQFLREGHERLFQLDVRSGTPQAVSTEAAASRRRFYTLSEEDGTRHNRVEAYFALIESHAAPALKRYLSDPAGLIRGDRATLCFFFSFLEGRTPAGVEEMASARDHIMRTFLGAYCGDPETFAMKHRDSVGEGTDEEIERLRQRMLQQLEDGSIAFPDMHELGLRAAFDAAAATFQLIYQLRWTLLRATSSEFVTSDRGLAMFEPTPRWPWSGPAWLSSPNVQVTIPLSRDACLLLTPGDGPTEESTIQEIDAASVDRVNLRTYGWATRYIYGSSQETVSRVRHVAKKQHAAIPRPKPATQVMLVEWDANDDTLAREHERRGWPSRLLVKGVPHDYVVMDMDGNPVGTSARVMQLAKRRAMRGLDDEEQT